MHVVQLTQRFPPALGGVETHVYHLAMGLSKVGISTEIFTTDLLNDISFRRVDGNSVPVPFPVRRFRAMKCVELPHGLGIFSPSMLAALLKDQCEVLHAHAYGYFPTLAAGIAELLRQVPLIVTPHSDPGGRSISKRFFDWVVPAATLRRADRVIALTKIEARNLQRLGVPATRIRIIPNGVDMAEFTAGGDPRETGYDPEILFVGRCYPRQKGLEHLIRALGLLMSAWGPHLTIVGEDWGGVGPLQAMASDLGIDKQVTFTGALPRTEVIRAYKSADVFVLPSLFEPFGIVLLEAMAAGLPVVASRVGGIPEVVEDGRTGFLVPPGDPEALAQALERLFSDRELRRDMGREGRLTASRYSWDRITTEVVAVYREAIEERDGARVA